MKGQIPYGTGGNFLNNREAISTREAGCMQSHPTFPSPHFILPVWSFVAVSLTLDSNFLEDRGGRLCTFERTLVPRAWHDVLPAADVDLK